MKAARAADAIPDAPAQESETEEPKRNRQHERSQVSTARLLGAAAELFAEHGYQQTSLADIGKRAGYSHGLVTRRFGSKLGLLTALLDHMIDDWTQKTLGPAVADQTGIPGFRAFFGTFCENAKTNSHNLKALESLMFEGLWGEPELKERLGAVQKNGDVRFRELIDKGIKDGTVRKDADAAAISQMASAALRGATYRWLLEDDFDFCGAMTAFGDVLEALLRNDGPSGRRK